MANMDKSGDRLKAGAQLLNSKLLALANWQRQLTVFTIQKKNHSVWLVHFGAVRLVQFRLVSACFGLSPLT